MNVCSLGFQVGHHVVSLTGAILTIFRSAYEWRVSNPCCMFIGDVLQAFDNVNPLLMSSTMNVAGAHLHLNAAILEETDNLSAEVRFEDLTVKVPYNNKMRQGSKEAPPIF